jgi:hypothetical protein
MSSSKESPLELKPRSHQKILDLIQRGVDIPNPLTLDIDEEVRNRTIPLKRFNIRSWKKKSSEF